MNLMNGPIKDMPVPLMGPPFLIDEKTGFAIAQMPVIVLYAGETLRPQSGIFLTAFHSSLLHRSFFKGR